MLNIKLYNLKYQVSQEMLSFSSAIVWINKIFQVQSIELPAKIATQLNYLANCSWGPVCLDSTEIIVANTAPHVHLALTVLIESLPIAASLVW